ncbi:MAG TPA: hypothetical protein VF215_09585 [Thermoanaerobaculia bacterium]
MDGFLDLESAVAGRNLSARIKTHASGRRNGSQDTDRCLIRAAYLGGGDSAEEFFPREQGIRETSSERKLSRRLIHRK